MRVVNRRLGRGIAAGVAQTRATPDQLTAASFVAFLAAAGLLVGVAPSVPVAVGATVLLQLGFALDSADGQLARLRGTGSPAGEWLDHVVDAARHLLFHLAVLVGLVRFADVPDVVLLVPLGFAVVSSVRFFAQILAEQLAGRDPVAGPASVPRFGVWIQAPADTGLLNLVVLLWAWTTPYLAVYGMFAALNALLLVATVVRRHRELGALPREQA
ncbi:CDP-alcohol phosphatidyltransferase family protein [Aeromicrobium fastidiosum]|uniref:CDP-alcohol phosphatidyltransferase family protein n=2 Tax=Aeromicrobium fastidiosum TaxID=52699 RepID=A0A641ASE7_9ACTN|nr:CDP-alcohol phosphatidyltransferase family protein [Aeromicrobium fastidiosum]